MGKVIPRMENARVRRKIPRLLRDYVEACRPPPDADPKRNGGRLATLAGFCRYLNCGIRDFEVLKDCDPALFDHVCAVLEDEALNFSPSPTLLSAYLKKRLGYAEGRSETEKESSCGEVRLIFEHDIEEDGA